MATTYASSEWLTSKLQTTKSSTGYAVNLTVHGCIQASSGGWNGYGIHVYTMAGSYYGTGKTDKWSQYTMADAGGVLDGASWVADADSTVTFPKKKSAYTAKVWASVYSAEVSGMGAWPYGVPGQNIQEFTIPALDSHTVKFKANGGSGAPDSQTKWYGEILTLSKTKPTRTGYTFQGWGTSETATKVAYAAGAQYGDDKNITLYAVWKANTFKLSYSNGGHGTAPNAQTKTYGEAITLRGAMSVTGYTFNGWKCSADSKVYAAGATYKGNAACTFTAQWTAITYTVTLKPNYSGASDITKKWTYGTTAVSLGTISRSNYTFLGWYTSASGGTKVTTFSTASNDITYYAHWKLNYSAPSITKVVAKRNDTTTTTSTCNVTVYWTKDAAIDGHVSIAIGTSTLDPVTVDKVASGKTEFSAVGSLLTTSKYTVTATITDGSGQTASKSTIITPVFFTLDFGSNGKSIGIGQAAADDITTTNGQLDIAMKTNLTGGATIGTSTVGSATKPIYLSNGTLTAGTYTLGANLTVATQTLATKAWIKKFGNVVTLYLDGYAPGKAIATKVELPIAVPEGFRPAHTMWWPLIVDDGDSGKRLRIDTDGSIKYRGSVTLAKNTAIYFTATWVI